VLSEPEQFKVVQMESTVVKRKKSAKGSDATILASTELTVVKRKKATKGRDAAVSESAEISLAKQKKGVKGSDATVLASTESTVVKRKKATKGRNAAVPESAEISLAKQKNGVKGSDATVLASTESTVVKRKKATKGRDAAVPESAEFTMATKGHDDKVPQSMKSIDPESTESIVLKQKNNAKGSDEDISIVATLAATNNVNAPTVPDSMAATMKNSNNVDSDVVALDDNSKTMTSAASDNVNAPTVPDLMAATMKISNNVDSDAVALGYIKGTPGVADLTKITDFDNTNNTVVEFEVSSLVASEYSLHTETSTDEKMNIINKVDSSALSHDQYKRTIFSRASNIKPFPIKLQPIKESNAHEKQNINAYLHIKDMTSFPCCGYCYILRLVDPIARYGHALPMKSNSIEVIELTLNKVLSIARHHPNLIYVDNAYVQLLTRAPNYSNITMVEMPHSPLMVAETNKFSAQLDLWLEENNNNWLLGLPAVQAVTNILPLTM
jgi:hypothetical protein